MVTFDGDWATLVPRMEEVAAENGVMEIVLPPEEHQRLEEGGLEELKQRVSPQLARRIVLLEDYPVSDGGHAPILLVAHLGSCRH